MKKSIVLSVFTFLFFSVSTSFAQNDLLLGKWKIDKIITKKIYDYGEQVIENPEIIADGKPQEIIDEENSIQNFIDKGSFFEIKAKNVFIVGFYNFIADEILPIKTTWYYMNEDKKAFNIAPQETQKVVKNSKSSKITARNSVEYTIYQIVELSEDKLMLFIEKENISYELSRAK